MDQLLTVVIQTSPLPSHPSTALLEALFRSFDKVKGLKDCNIVILCDGCDEEEASGETFKNQSATRPTKEDDGVSGEGTALSSIVDSCEKSNNAQTHIENSVQNHEQQIKVKNGGTIGKTKRKKSKHKANFKHGTVSPETAKNYHLHLQLLEAKVTNREEPFVPTSSSGSIQLLKLPHRHGSARAIDAAFRILNILTPYVMVGQHDNFFVEEVSYLKPLLDFMDREGAEPWLQCVHFPSTATLNYVEKIKRRYGLDLEKFCRRCNGLVSEPDISTSSNNGIAFSQSNSSVENPQNQNDVQIETPPPKPTINSLNGTFVPLVFWYGRTHMARTSYYTDNILRHFPLQVGDHLEELWGTHQLKDILSSLASVRSGGSNGSINGNKTDSVASNQEKTDHIDHYNDTFRTTHSKYGNYVFFHKARSEQQEVLYHLSGRKAKASTMQSAETTLPPMASSLNSKNKETNFQPHGASFTTARRALGVVPGLEMPSSAIDQNSGDGEPSKAKSFGGRFRQHCFHCGVKGHSFKYCPDMRNEKEKMPTVEVLDLA